MRHLAPLLILVACHDEVTEAPVFSPPGGLFAAPQGVSIASATEGAEIRWTYAPAVPSETNGTLYADPIHVAGPVEISAVAYRQGMDPSAVVTEVYEVYQTGPEAPLLDPGTGIYLGPVSVTMTTGTIGAHIGYTTDGTDPAPGNATIYTGTPLTLTGPGTTEVRAVAYQSGVTSWISSATYTLAEGQVDAPFFTPGAGRLTSLQPIIIGSGTVGAEIHYTTDGSFPTCGSGAVYTDPVPLQSGDTLSAIACKAGWLDSVVVSGRYEFGFWLMINGHGDVLRSDDRGHTWTVAHQWPGLLLGDLATDGRGGWVLTSLYGGALFSDDRAATWSSSATGLSLVFAVATDGYAGWAVGGARDLAPQLRISTDGGASWDLPAAPGVSSGIEDIASDGVVWIAVSSSGEVLRSVNTGGTWVEILDEDRVLYDVATNGAGTWVAAGLQGGGYPYTTDSYVMASTDDGQTWQEADYTSVARGALSLGANETTGAFLIGGDGTLIRSYDGATWETLSPIHPTRDVRFLASQGPQWLAGLVEDGVTEGELYESWNDGQSWSPVAGFSGAAAGPMAFGF